MSTSIIHPATRIGHVHLKVADLERALGFYRDVLGFELTQRFGSSAAFLSAGGYHHHLGTNTWAAGAGQPLGNEARLLEWEIVLPSSDDRAAAAQSLRAAGYAAEADGESWGVSDPWNTILRLR